MILVTGATGLLGAALVQLLNSKSKKVRAVYRSEKKMKEHPILNLSALDSVEWFQADLLHLDSYDELFKDVDQVYHCAAQVSFDASDQASMLRNNRDLTAILVDESLRREDIRFLHVSSVAALNTENRLRVLEGEAWDPPEDTSTYGMSKYYAELEVWRGIQLGLNAVIVNPSLIIGPAPWGQSSSNLFKMVAKGMSFYSPGGTGFVAAKDCAEIMLKLMESEFHSERFLINGENLSYKTFFQSLAKALDVKKPSICPPRWASEIAWRLSFLARKLGFNTFLSKESVRSAYGTKKYFAEKVVNRLNYQFQPIEECIKETAHIYKKTQV